MGVVNICLMVMGAVAVPFKALSNTVTVIDRRVTYHQANDLYALTLDIVKKRKKTFSPRPH